MQIYFSAKELPRNLQITKSNQVKKKIKKKAHTSLIKIKNKERGWGKEDPF